MLDTLTPTYTARFDENSQELSLIGSMRPQHEADMAKCLQVLEQSLRLVRGTLYINVKRLVRVNNIAFRILAAALVNAATERPDLKIKIITSSVVGWSTKKFGVLSAVNANLIVEEYDNEFYPGQTFVENSDFIHVLRTQTKMTWRHERSILPRHGLKPGMKVADRKSVV